MPTHPDRVTEPIKEDLRKDTDEGRRAAMKKWAVYEKRETSLREYPVKQVAGKKSLEMDDGGRQVAIFKDKWFNWVCKVKCGDCVCKGTYSGVLLSTNSLYGYERGPHEHGTWKYPAGSYDEDGLLRELSDLLTTIERGDPNGLVDYERAERLLDEALGNHGSEEEEKVYFKIAGDLPSWLLRHVIKWLEYIGITGRELQERMASHVVENLLPFTDAGGQFNVLYVYAPKEWVPELEKLFYRQIAQSPRLLNKKMGPSKQLHISLVDEKKGAAMKLVKALKKAGVKYCDWRDKREEHDKRRSGKRASDFPSPTKSDVEYPRHIELKREEQELEAKLRANRKEQGELKRRSAQARVTRKRKRPEETDDL